MIFRPTYTIDSIYNLDINALKNMGIKAIFSDLDNTLLAWNNFETDDSLQKLERRLADADIKLIVISNNSSERISKVLDVYRIEFAARARKPLPIGINKAIAKYNLNKSDVLMVGDQLLTDIVAGNLAGVRTVLVKPLVETDKWNTRINRCVEKFIFLFLDLLIQLSLRSI
ncbi:HAD phosphatase, family IIIA [Lactobacillus iners LactinV 11V1-d]|nr:YqeG family HAD IIIA-type phosphatase [Lactobacillus iners]EFO66935.1 HAD phosphatase, family IIIA [Lactobacillus iners LactinV 11V1-d]EFO68682.1 HAD phosphatase, family IIIA [Lactobacillus iners LactinV 03V1-b]EFO71493.1 HAD phosphatase, family IIIA [Lactobacillus iners SPIN 2503V10-D]EFQ47249.1 HAD phosphatase, family IIIA [Lactobacillus iners LEAF 2053A-b]